MKSRINQLIPIAIDVAGTNFMQDKKGNAIDYIPKEFKGYISSFGASVIQSGIVAAMAFFKNDEGASFKRSLILTAIYQILEINSKSGDLLKYYTTECPENERALLKDKIMDAATALKLAIRTYELKETKK